LQRIPAHGAHRTSGALGVELDAGLEQLLPQRQLDRIPGSLHRDQMELAVTDHRVQAAACGEDDEQLEIRLVVLDDVLPNRSRLGGLRAQSEVPRQLVREAVHGGLDQRTGALTLA